MSPASSPSCLIVSFGVWGIPQLVVRFSSIKSTEVLRIGTVVAILGGRIALLPYFNGALSRLLYPETSQIPIRPSPLD